MIYYEINNIASLQLLCKNKLSEIEINIPEMVIQRKNSLNTKDDSENGKKSY